MNERLLPSSFSRAFKLVALARMDAGEKVTLGGCGRVARASTSVSPDASRPEISARQLWRNRRKALGNDRGEP
jgi:hypothetical protein